MRQDKFDWMLSALYFALLANLILTIMIAIKIFHIPPYLLTIGLVFILIVLFYFYGVLILYKLFKLLVKIIKQKKR
jgi:hypothetical protein